MTLLISAVHTCIVAMLFAETIIFLETVRVRSFILLIIDIFPSACAKTITRYRKTVQNAAQTSLITISWRTCKTAYSAHAVTAPETHAISRQTTSCLKPRDVPACYIITCIRVYADRCGVVAYMTCRKRNLEITRFLSVIQQYGI